MSREQAVDPTAAERLSALMDGELQDPAEVAQGCRAWRDDGALRESWHSYHLIGDIMRSDDLAATGARDAAFLRGLRARLEAEPVVLAPSASPRAASSTRTGRRRWAGAAAVAAGFVAVAGVLVVTRAPAPEVVKQAEAPVVVPAPVVPVAVAPAQPEPAAPPVNGQLIRDARLDRYLAAHQQFAGSTALGPAAFLRRATTHAANR